ncbi:MAG TPA: hypothetical protein VN845_05845, partial [Solirubrobacteraceae bacterium]|nr:hypothetical protein [Solirubrobacteraceae bacterium]
MPAAAASASGGGERPALGKRSALVVFLPGGPQQAGPSESDTIESELASIPTLSTGILSATQGAYKVDQLLLDITQGARVSYSAYSPAYPPSLSSLTLGPGPSAHVSAWSAAVERAANAPQLLDPGLLAASIPGGAAYAAPYGVGAARLSGLSTANLAGTATSSAALAANRRGEIAAVSFGSPATLLARIATLRAGHRLVVADLPPGRAGYTDLRALATIRPSGELLSVIQSPPDTPGHELLWSAFAGLSPEHGTGVSGRRTLTSTTTNQRGLIAAIDIGPTILTHLGLPIPADMRGKPVRLDGTFDGATLRALKARLVVIDSRRLPALEWLVLAWIVLLAAAQLPFGRSGGDAQPSSGDRLHGSEQPSVHRDGSARSSSGREAQRRHTAWALRTGALAVLWTPVAVLVPAALEPDRTTEFALIVAICFALGTLTDRL